MKTIDISDDITVSHLFFLFQNEFLMRVHGERTEVKCAFDIEKASERYRESEKKKSDMKMVLTI